MASASESAPHPQADFVQKIMPTIEAAIDKLTLPTAGVVSIADLGCTLGPSTISNARAIIDWMKKNFKAEKEDSFKLGRIIITNVKATVDKMKKKSKPEILKLPEFQVYFQDFLGTDIEVLSRRLSTKANLQDFAGTDLNTLFQRFSRKAYYQNLAGTYVFSRTSFRRHDKAEKVEKRVEDKYSSISLPGSFYGYQPLFPPSSIYFAISSFQLHWLSKAPPEILDENSKIYNTELHNATFSTLKAYADQAEEDLDSFLASRAEEMVHGGYLVLVVGIRDKYCPFDNGKFSQLQERMWELLFSHGWVERDTYRTMIYYRTMDEITRVLRFRKEFRVEKIEEHPSLLESYGSLSTEEIMDSLMEGGVKLLRAHFGQESTDLFLKESRRAPNIALIVLKRK